MASPLKATQALKHNMAIKQIEKGCELTAMLGAHLGILKDATDSPFWNIFEEISHTFALSRDILTKSDQNLLGSKLVTSQASGGAEIHKRKRDDKFKDSQRRRYNNKRTNFTTMPDHDGYQWRKYGQKNILSKIHPRSYYRCTYHKDRSCMAAKQVQQCNDEYPPLFEVNYFEEHTCNNIPMSNSRFTLNENILDFSGKSIPESNLSANAMGCRRQADEDAALVSCLTNVITGSYNSRMSERSDGGPKALNTSIESSLLIDDDKTLLREDEFPVDHGSITMDLEWLEQDNIQFLLETLPPI
ncbi:WRKY DNA binding domain containing protein [Carex littledalei]|uniref:WRKY DNA binding domain containing protein n=1 Tax=Carex littledalei TaxID=544730 RepID=A0A833VDS8_9POAL|nr:WRKY DNA binding domain containing protein [Carex littledalei]